MKRFFLLPGKIACFKEESEITTNLGSCVAVCLHDSRTLVGGMNHYLLPLDKKGQSQTGRYGDKAIEQLYLQMVQLGASRKHLKAKVYGGANTLKQLNVAKGIGENNIAQALSALKKLSIPIVAKDVGGDVSRKITMNTKTFEVVLNKGESKETQNTFEVAGYAKQVTPKKVTVAIVDDHPEIQALYAQIFKMNGLEVVGSASDAMEARQLIVKTRPMVVTLDIEMPNMSGVDFLEKLMKHLPTPVVMVSHINSCAEEALRALELGAVEFVQKPTQLNTLALRQMAESLVDKVKAAATASKGPTKSPIAQTPSALRRIDRRAKVILVGGNTGSPKALKHLIQHLPSNCPPIIVANSTISHFIPTFIESQKNESALTLCLGKHKEALQPGHMYFIPESYNGTLERKEETFTLCLEASEKDNHTPAIDPLFASAATNSSQDVIAILLSGFGEDGIAGFEALSEEGNITIVHSPDEAPLSHTPQKAISLGLADYVATSSEILELARGYTLKKAA